jgi:predicted transcriptional regulator
MSAGSPTGALRRMVLIHSESSPLKTVSGDLQFLAAGPRASLRLLPDQTEVRGLAGSFVLDSPRSLHETLFYEGDAQPYEQGPRFYPKFGAPMVADQLNDQPLAFRGRVVVTDYLVRLGGLAVDTRWTTTGPEQSLGTEVLQTHVLVVEGDFGITALGPNWTHSIQSLTGHLEGDLLLANARGSGSVNGSALRTDLHLFQSVGPLNVTANYEGSRGRWALNGEPRYVALNAQPVFASRDALKAAAAIGAGALLVAALAKWGRAILGFVPGLNIARPFGNRHRTEVLVLVAKNPGIDQMELTKSTGTARATVRHHLRILLRADLLTERRIGSRSTYTLNDSSYEFPANGHTGLSAAKAFASMRHPVRLALVEILRGSERTNASMLEACCKRGLELSRDDVRYHMKVLEDEGVVGKATKDGRILWRLLVDFDDVASKQRERFLAMGGLRTIFEALEEQPADLRQLRRKIQPKWQGSLSDLADKLALLSAAGFAIGDSQGYRRVM